MNAEEPSAGEFQVGDLVQLKSGGPPMTILVISPFNIERGVLCSWFTDDQRNQSNWFGAITLKRVKPAADEGELIDLREPW